MLQQEYIHNNLQAKERAKMEIFTWQRMEKLFEKDNPNSPHGSKQAAGQEEKQEETRGSNPKRIGEAIEVVAVVIKSTNLFYSELL
jgi:hypothetical protein